MKRIEQLLRCLVRCRGEINSGSSIYFLTVFRLMPSFRAISRCFNPLRCNLKMSKMVSFVLNATSCSVSLKVDFSLKLNTTGVANPRWPNRGGLFYALLVLFQVAHF